MLLPDGLEWIHSRTGQRPSNDKLSPEQPTMGKKPTQSSEFLGLNPLGEKLFQLPDPKIVRENFEA